MYHFFVLRLKFPATSRVSIIKFYIYENFAHIQYFVTDISENFRSVVDNNLSTKNGKKVWLNV